MSELMKLSSTLTFATEEERADIFDAMEEKITHLQTKLAESEARVDRLEKAALISIHALSGGEAKAEVRDIYDETPTQSLATHECLFIDEFLNHLRYEFDWLFGEDNPQERALQNCAIDFIKLRQQQTNGE